MLIRTWKALALGLAALSHKCDWGLCRNIWVSFQVICSEVLCTTPIWYRPQHKLSCLRLMASSEFQPAMTTSVAALKLPTWKPTPVHLHNLLWLLWLYILCRLAQVSWVNQEHVNCWKGFSFLSSWFVEWNKIVPENCSCAVSIR